MIKITDVTLRDGLQMENAQFSLEQKLQLAEALVACNYQRLEITSFVNPKWVPQFQDSQSFTEAFFKKFSSVEAMAFVPNLKGFERLAAFPITWASTFIATSETFNKKNVNVSIDETAKELAEVVRAAREKKKKIRIYISTVFGCPYEKEISDAQLRNVFQKVADLRPDEIALSDTIGVATPSQVKHVLKLFEKVFPKPKTALHFHDTYGLALACAEAGLSEGIESFDGTTGGIGGCPYAKGATGNVASEKLAYLFSRQGRFEFSFESVKKVYPILEKTLNVKVPSNLFEIYHKGANWYGVD